MDHFGIGRAIAGAASIYLHAARQSGRTTSLVESVKNGDRIIFCSDKEAKRVESLCRERDVTITTLVIDPKTSERIFDFPTSEGRTIFDHSWVEQRYLNAIDNIAKEIDHLEQQSSGYGAAHRETRRKFQEMAKWNIPPPGGVR